jgi:outer membrane lipoprotein-sorting protein
MRRALAAPLAACVVVVAAAGCAGLMKLPTGAGMPAPDAAAALAQATAACAGIRTLSAELAISGKVAGQRMRGRLLAGVAAPASARLEATAPFGSPVFIFVATGEDATLLLPRDARVLEHGRPGAVLSAITGVPLDARELRVLLTGCVPPGSVARAKDLGPQWRVVTVSEGDSSHDVYLRRERAAQPWRLVAAVRAGATDPAWRAEYADFQNGLPRAIRLTTKSGSAESEFDLQIALSQVEINVALDAGVFHVDVPSSADPITLDELRSARPGIRKN